MARCKRFSRIQHEVPDSLEVSPRNAADVCPSLLDGAGCPVDAAQKSKSLSFTGAPSYNMTGAPSYNMGQQHSAHAVSSWASTLDHPKDHLQRPSQDSIKSAVLMMHSVSSRCRVQSMAFLSSSQSSIASDGSLRSLSTSSSAVHAKQWVLETPSCGRRLAGESTWSVLVPENDNVTQIFINGRETPGMMIHCAIVAIFLLLFFGIIGLLADRTSLGMAYGFGVSVYCSLSHTSILRLPLLVISCMCAFFFRVVNFWNRIGNMMTNVATVCVLFYLFLAAIASMTRDFPVIPLGIAMLHIPVTVVFVRGILAREYDPARVYRIIFVTCSLISGLLFVWCGISLSMLGKRWDSETQEMLRQSLEECGQDFVDWQACDAESSGDSAADACSKLDLVAVLIWIAPVAESILFITVALFCAFRAWFLSKHALRQLGIIVHITVGFAHLIAVAFWVATSVSGINREMSLAILFLMGISCIGFLVWVYFSIVLSDLLACARNEPLVVVFAPLVASDEFKGCIFSVAFAITVPFLLFEIAVRRCQRMLRILSKSRNQHTYLTPSALKIIRVVEGWNWCLVLEQAFWWELFFVIAWVCCSQLTVVFMAGMSEALEGESFVKFCFLLYASVLAFFTVVPIPGIPIHFCFGCVVVRKACREKQLNFTHGLMIACGLSWLLKLTAASMQLACGRLLSRSVRVQEALGIHRSWLRAMRGILTREGTTFDKVFIMCGGPDWPTAILAGVFRIGWWETLKCLLPSTAVILPCVFAGALHTDASWSIVSRVVIAVMTLLQGMLSFRACVVVLQVMQAEAEELKLQRRPSMEALYQHVQRHAEVSKLKSLCSEWTALNRPCQALLVTATLAEMSCCWILFFLSALCFREFDIMSDINAPLQDGGLNGRPWNVVTLLGACTLGVSIMGLVLMGIYYVMMHRKMRQVLRSTALLKQQVKQHLAASDHCATRGIQGQSCQVHVDLMEATLPHEALAGKGTPHFSRRSSLGSSAEVAVSQMCHDRPRSFQENKSIGNCI